MASSCSSTSTTDDPCEEKEDVGVRTQGMSQGFHIMGNVKINNANTIIFGTHNTVIKRKCSRRSTEKLPISQSIDFISRVKLFLERHYQTQENEATPLPWCQDFQLRMKDVYTTLELLGASRIGGQLEYCKKIELHELLNMEDEDDGDVFTIKRILLEGNPGYGKSTLACKLVFDWSCGKEYLSKYVLVFLIVLRNLKGDLKNYIEECCIPRQDANRCHDVWDYICNNEDKILFILDGLDELAVDKSQQIYELLEGKLFQNTTVIVTTRPLKTSNETLRFCKRRIVIHGFNDEQIGNFVKSYFRAVKRDEFAEPLLRYIMDEHSHYRSLATCPMACLMLCVLYQDNKVLPNNLTDIYSTLLECLARRSLARAEINADWSRGIPPLYKLVLSRFGHFCYDALRRDQLIFDGQQLAVFMGDDLQTLLATGLLLKDYNIAKSISIRHSLACQEQYQLLHKTFVEYLAAYYLLNLPEVTMRLNLCSLRRDNESSFITVAKFLIGLLEDKAHIVIKIFGLFDYPDYVLFGIVRECKITPNNLRILSTIMNSSEILISSRNLDVEGWGSLLEFPNCGVRKVEFKWDEPPVNTTFLRNFAEKFLRNQSVANLQFSYSYSLELEPEQKRYVAEYMARLLRKPNLRTFAVLGNQAGSELARALALELQKSASCSLMSTLELHTLLTDEDVALLSKEILNRKDLLQLVFARTQFSRYGYTALAELLTRNPTINYLTVIPEQITEPRSPRTPAIGRLSPGINGEEPSSPYYSLSPECDSARHRDDIHNFIMALRDPRCNLSHLKLHASTLSRLDFNCLGQTLRQGRSLQSLALTNVIDFECIVPVFAALEHNSLLEDLDVRSPKLVVNNTDVLRYIIPAIRGNRTLLSLDISGWAFELETDTLSQLKDCFVESQLLEVNVGSCSFSIACDDLNNSGSSLMSVSARTTPETKARLRRRKSLDSFMRNLSSGVRNMFQKKKHSIPTGPKLTRVLAPHIRISVGEGVETMVRAPEFLPYLSAFRNLTELDLSCPITQTSPGAVCLDDEETTAFFSTLAVQLGGTLQVLHLSSWGFVWSTPSITAELLSQTLAKLIVLHKLNLKNVSYEIAENAHGLSVGGPSTWHTSSSYGSLRRYLKKLTPSRNALHELFLTSILTALPALQEITLPRLTWCQSEYLLHLLQKFLLFKADLLIFHLQFVGRQAQIYLRDHIRLLDNVVIDELYGSQGTLLIRRAQLASTKTKPS